jgi:hypothetical protein
MRSGLPRGPRARGRGRARAGAISTTPIMYRRRAVSGKERSCSRWCSTTTSEPATQAPAIIQPISSFTSGQAEGRGETAGA